MKQRRLTQVARILAELLAGEAAHRARRIRSAGRDSLPAERERARALRIALEELGPLYIKLGQLLSTRPDLVSESVIESLQDLHEEVMIRPFAEFETVLAANLGTDWRDRFSSFEAERPLGAASMAQVYAATLPDGREVVVKVLRPHVAEQIDLDMQILALAVKQVMRRFPRQAELFQPDAMLETIFVAMRPEIDFTVEAANIRAFQKYTEGYRFLTVPQVIEVTKEVLIMTRAPGRSIRSCDPSGLSDEQRRAVAHDVATLLFRGFLVDGVFHADPHPGNIFIQAGEPATLIDFGMIGRIDRRTALGYTRFMLAMALNDGQAAGRAVVEMSTLTARSDVPGFLSDMGRWVPSVVNLSLANAEFGATFNQFLVFCSRRHIAVNPAVALFGKASANLEGTLRAIAPELTPVDVFRDVMGEVLRDQAKQMAAGGELMRLANETFIAAHALPEQARYLAQAVFDGQFVLRTRDDMAGVAADRADLRAKQMRRVLLGLGTAALWLQYRRQR